MNFLKTAFGLVTLALSLISAQTCSTVNAELPKHRLELQSITVKPDSATTTVQSVLQYTATGNYSDGSRHDLTRYVTWTISSSVILRLNDLRPSYKNVTCLAPGVASVSATYRSVKGTTTTTCTSGATLSSVTVTPSSSAISVGNTQSYAATAHWSDLTSTDVTSISTWSSGNTSAATIPVSGSNPMVATAVGVGSSTITATYLTLSGSSALTVNPGAPPTVSSIAVTPANTTVSAGFTQQYTAIATYSDASTQNITSVATWGSSVPSSATVNSSGLATTLQIGNPTISATYSGKTGSTGLTVSSPVVVSVAVTPSSATIPATTTQNYTATATLSDNSQSNVTAAATWVSSSPSIATIPSTGTNPAVATGVAQGSTTITATYSGHLGNSVLTVGPATPPSLVSIVVTPSNVSNIVGQSTNFTAIGHYSDSSTQNITSQATWGSTNNSIASMSVSAVSPRPGTCNGVGTVTINATLTSIVGTTNFSCTAVPPTLQSITIAPVTPTQFVGQSTLFTATGHYSDSSTQNLTLASTWHSTNVVVASFGASANPQPAACNAAGTTTITATDLGITSTGDVLTCQNSQPATSGMDAYCGPGDVAIFGATMDGPAALPSTSGIPGDTCNYTNPTAFPETGTVRTVTDTASWNTVWAATRCDDVVEIPSGTTVSIGQVTLPALVCPAGHYRTLRPSGYHTNFPAYNTLPYHISPHYWGVASLAGYPSLGSSPVVNVGATITTSSLNPGIFIAQPFSGLQIEGIKITRNAGTGSSIGSLVALNGTGPSDRLIFRQVWGSGSTNPSDETVRFMGFTGVSKFSVVNSTFTEFRCKAGGNCTQAQVFFNGTNNTGVVDHTVKMVGNFCAGAGQGCYLGGGGSANVTETGMEYRLNWAYKPWTWNSLCTVLLCGVDYDGFQAQVENNFELKNGDRVLVEGNVFENNWDGFSQNGSQILLTPKNQSGTGCPLCVVTNVTIRYNYGTRSNYAIQVADISPFATAGNSYSIHDNVFDDLGYIDFPCRLCAGDSGNAMDGGLYTGFAPASPSGTNFLHDVVQNHNDMIPAAGTNKKAGTIGFSGPIASDPQHMTRWTYTNNLTLFQNGGAASGVSNPLDQCASGLDCNCLSAPVTPTAQMNACFGTYTFGGNAMVNTTPGVVWPGVNNCVAETSLASIFVNYNNGVMSPGGDFHVKPTSPCHNVSLDGKDPGADINALTNAISGVRTF